MHHVKFENNTEFPVGILIKEKALRKGELQRHYVDKLEKLGVPKKDVIGWSLKYNDAGKAPVSLIKEYLGKLLPALKTVGTKYIFVADSAYFKVLSGQKKADGHIGYVYPCAIKGFEDMDVCLLSNWQAVFFNPSITEKIDMGLKALADKIQGAYQSLGQNIIHSVEYLKINHPREVRAFFDSLHQYPELTCDLEAFSLAFYEAGIGTIGFAWDEHNGKAIRCDYKEVTDRFVGAQQDEEGRWYQRIKNKNLYGIQENNTVVKTAFRHFLETYEGKIIWHNAGYDCKVCIYELWMQNIGDHEGLLKGLEVMTRRVDDTQIISYLATNSCAGNKLGLKDQAHEFAGNWAMEDIKDIRLIPLDDLLQYNVVDCLSTWYTYKKNYPIMVADQQEDIYNTIFKPSLKLLLQVELTGMPLDMDRVFQVQAEMQKESETQLALIRKNPFTQKALANLKMKALITDYESRRDKAKNPGNIKKKDMSAFDDFTFNPNSNTQVIELVYEVMDLPVIDRTKTKQPMVGGDTLKKVMKRTDDPVKLEVLQALRDYADVAKILSTFITAFIEKSAQDPHGNWFLFGNFKLGGTVSGRLSSNNPNLQNLPSNSRYAKAVKSCFRAPKGWIFAGADYWSLEDRISALTTKDPMKLKVYTDGFDGHCLRAYGYFGDQMPDINGNDPKSVNSIQDHPVYKVLRQDSKAPTFALTYQGTWHTMVKNLGWPKDKAKAVESAYHEMYHVSTKWVADRLEQASKDGYVTVAFGLRLRTPLLKQVLWGSSVTPYEAEAEGRTAGNAMGQSYGMLNNRAGIEFQQRTLASEHRLDVLPCAHIHDAQYFMIRDNVDAVQFVNNNLTECMAWQELPEIQHPEVKLGGDLDLFYPDWSKGYTLPHNLTDEKLIEFCQQSKEK